MEGLSAGNVSPTFSTAADLDAKSGSRSCWSSEERVRRGSIPRRAGCGCGRHGGTSPLIRRALPSRMPMASLIVAPRRNASSTTARSSALRLRGARHWMAELSRGDVARTPRPIQSLGALTAVDGDSPRRSARLGVNGIYQSLGTAQIPVTQFGNFLPPYCLPKITSLNEHDLSGAMEARTPGSGY